MKTKPILFSTTMVQALQNGSKTQTRRVMKPQPQKDGSFWTFGGAGWSGDSVVPVYGHSLANSCPYGAVGDILWVRETFGEMFNDGVNNQDYIYKADKKNDGFSYLYKPSIFMPKAACRIFLKITGVRVERLQSISETDAIAEGVQQILPEGTFSFKSYVVKNGGSGVSAYVSYRTLWQSINGPESWDANPWVWVVTFERCEKPQSFGEIPW